MTDTDVDTRRTLVDDIVAVARRAGRAIEATRQSAAHAELKRDGSPVTDSDRAAEAVILSALAELDPATPVVSEERGVPPAVERRAWTRFWLVDPLDGTREFVEGLPDYTVNIALIEEREPVLGAIYAPARRVVYFAGKGIGAWRQEDGRDATRITSRPARAGMPLRLVESRAHRSTALDAFADRLPVLERISVGSSLKFCWLAEGRADLYPRFTPIMEWDVAAGDCIFRWSSPTTIPRYSPLVYNGPDMRIPGFVLGFRPADVSPPIIGGVMTPEEAAEAVMRSLGAP